MRCPWRTRCCLLTAYLWVSGYDPNTTKWHTTINFMHCLLQTSMSQKMLWHSNIFFRCLNHFDCLVLPWKTFGLTFSGIFEPLSKIEPNLSCKRISCLFLFTWFYLLIFNQQFFAINNGRIIDRFVNLGPCFSPQRTLSGCFRIKHTPHYSTGQCVTPIFPHL